MQKEKQENPLEKLVEDTLHTTPPASSSKNIKDLPKNKKIIIPAAVVLVLLIVGIVFLATKDDNHQDTKQTNAPMYFDYNKCLSEQKAAGKDASAAGEDCQNEQRKYNLDHGLANDTNATGSSLGNADSTDPMQKGLALGNGQCTGTGSTKLTHAPMNMSDVETIQPMGLMIAAHVTPVDHQYYYQKNPQAPSNTYPVYATMDGTIVGVQHTGNAWFVVLSHSCTFYSQYNLMTDISDAVKSKLPANWGPNSNGGVKVPVKSGQIIGYVGGQSLDFCVWNTEKTLPGLLYRTAYNNREPWKVNTVNPLNYFNDSVKKDILTRYVRTDEPRDGKIDYDVDGQAVGNWFVAGTNGYAGGNDISGNNGFRYANGHLALAYDYIDSKAPEFSIGDYQGGPAQFAVIGSVDWTKITPNSGLAKVELGEVQRKANGVLWNGSYTTGIKMSAGPSKATALLQMTDTQTMKVELFPDKTPAQVSGFTSAAKTYNRGQDAKMVQSSTATP